MYKKIYIDKNMVQLITEDFKKILIDSSIPFDFIDELNILDRNTLYLTNDKKRLSKNLINVFLLTNDYDFLDVKNTIFIKNIEDVINVIKDDVWKQWAQELQFLAQCSLAYSKDKFD